jgi:hypothetical protein
VRASFLSAGSQAHGYVDEREAFDGALRQTVEEVASLAMLTQHILKSYIVERRRCCPIRLGFS